MNNQKTCGDGNAENCPGCWQCFEEDDMGKHKRQFYLNGRVGGFNYQLRIESFADLRMAAPSTADMVVFDAFGQPVDSFERQFHYQYHNENIRQFMREKYIVRRDIPEIKET